MLDIFNGDAFSVARMTKALNDITYIPGRLGELGLFTVDNVDTTIISIETKGDLLVIVPPSQRGAPGSTVGAEPGRKLRAFNIPHFEINDFITADSIQNVRAFGSESALETLSAKIMSRLAIHVNSMAATEEHARMGAIKGIVSYADGSTLNLFNEFGVTANADIAFALTAANPVDGVLREKCSGITRLLSTALGNIPFSGIHALCGDNFFDALLKYPELRETYKGWSEAKILRESYIGPNRSTYGILEFGGIVFENYRGGSTPNAKGDAVQTFINTDHCHIFPLGVPNLFTTTYAPADYIETVNTLGRRLYTKQTSDRQEKGRHLDVQMNALQLCTRPKVLLKGNK